MTKPLHIPESKRIPGLHIYCSKCDCVVTEKCKLSALPLEKCAFGGSHRYKGIVYEKGSKRVSRTFGRDYNEAAAGVIALRAEVKQKANALKLPENIPQEKQREEPINSAPHESIAHLMAEYIAYLSNDPKLVIKQRKKERSKGHLDDCERVFLRFATAMKKNGRSAKRMHPAGVNDAVVGVFLDYLSDDLQLGDAAYNRAVTIMSSFYTHLRVRKGQDIVNPFDDIARKTLEQNVGTIEQHQFEALLHALRKPELGIRTLSNGVRKNYYRPFMPDLVELMCYSGRRRTETVLMKWTDIIRDADGSELIRVPDYKVNRAKGLRPDKWIYNYVPLTGELSSLLARLGRHEKEGRDEYIIGGNERMSRSTLASLASKSFAHYGEHLGIDLELTSLRRTNYSHLAAEIGIENAQQISGHAKIQTLKKFYVSKKVLAKSAKEFGVFKGRERRERGDDNTPER